METHEHYREQFITDSDLWSSIYSDNVAFKYQTIISADESEEVEISYSSIFKANSMFFFNDGRSKIKFGMINFSKNMTSVS